MFWNVVDTGVNTAEANMQWDADCLKTLSSQEKPLLHLYEWQTPSITYGHFMDVEKWIDLDKARTYQISLAKRPTGGGIVFHLWDMAFSALVPSHAQEFSSNTLENYAFINQAVFNAVSEFSSQALALIPEDAPFASVGCQHFCMARPTKYDVVQGGKKIAGAAQRKTKEGFLHQGTISLVYPDPTLLADVLKPGTGILEAILATTHPLIADVTQMQRAKESLKKLLATHLNLLSLKLRNYL